MPKNPFKKQKMIKGGKSLSLVADGENENVTPTKFAWIKHHKKISAAIAAAFLVGIGFVGWTLLINNPEPELAKDPALLVNNPCSPSANTDVFERSVKTLDPEHPERLPELAGLVDEIKQLEKYEDDPDCLYPVVYFHTRRTDVGEARDYHAKLESLLDQGKILNAQFNTDRETIKKQVEFLDIVEQESNQGLLFDAAE